MHFPACKAHPDAIMPADRSGRPMRKLLLIALAFIAASTAGNRATAQDYPTRPITSIGCAATSDTGSKSFRGSYGREKIAALSTCVGQLPRMSV